MLDHTPASAHKNNATHFYRSTGKGRHYLSQWYAYKFHFCASHGNQFRIRTPVHTHGQDSYFASNRNDHAGQNIVHRTLSPALRPVARSNTFRPAVSRHSSA